MLSQMDPALLTYCDKIAAEGGPSQIPDDLSGSILGLAPVVQMGTVTRTSARLRNVQPDVNLDRDYEGLKKPKKTADAVCTGIATATADLLLVLCVKCRWFTFPETFEFLRSRVPRFTTTPDNESFQYLWCVYFVMNRFSCRQITTPRFRPRNAISGIGQLKLISSFSRWC